MARDATEAREGVAAKLRWAKYVAQKARREAEKKV